MAQAAQRGEYANNWKEISDTVKNEASWCCARCCNYHNVASGHILTVHHFDGDRENNERWNLMPLCQRCHLSVQARVDPQVGLLHEPSNWIRPYIAGFYEAGFGVPGPTYDLAEWKAKYESAGQVWPAWAPQETL